MSLTARSDDIAPFSSVSNIPILLSIQASHYCIISAKTEIRSGDNAQISIISQVMSINTSAATVASCHKFMILKCMGG